MGLTTSALLFRIKDGDLERRLKVSILEKTKTFFGMFFKGREFHEVIRKAFIGYGSSCYAPLPTGRFQPGADG